MDKKNGYRKRSPSRAKNFFAAGWTRLCALCRTKKAKEFLFALLKIAVALLAAVLATVVVILIGSHSPRGNIPIVFLSPFQDSYSLANIVTQAVPLIFTGTAVCIMTRCKQFNMFVEGAFFLGAFAAAWMAPALPFPPVLLPLFCMIAAAVISGIVGYIPAKLKAGLGVNEFVSSLMLNFIVLWVVLYLLYHVVVSDEIYKTPLLEDGMKLPWLDRDNDLSSSILIALLVAVLGGLFLFKTKWGYRIRMTGDNPSFAEYCGINTKRTIVSSQVMGAGIAGLGGAAFFLGNYYRFNWKALPNYGFDGFVIAIMANNNPFLVPIASLFLAYLRVGALNMARLGDVPNDVIYMIQAIIIILFGATALFKKLSSARRKREEAPKEEEKEAVC